MTQSIRAERRTKRRNYLILPWEAPGNTSSVVWRPLISVVLPVYNHGAYLEEAVESVLKASNRPLELIIIDDGSTDDTPEVLKKFSGHDQITVVTQSNQGLSHTLNRAFHLVRGVFVTWTSADNRYRGRALDILADYLLANPQCGLVYANVALIDEKGAPAHGSSYRCGDQRPEDSSLLLLPRAAESLWMLNDNFINACFLYRRQVLWGAGAYEPDLLGFEDYAYWLRVSLFAKLAHVDTEEALYEYRLHGESLTAKLQISELAEKQKPLVCRTRSKQHLLAHPELLPLALRYPQSLAESAAMVAQCLTAAGHSVESSSSWFSDQSLTLRCARDTLTLAPSTVHQPKLELFRLAPPAAKIGCQHSSHLRYQINRSSALVYHQPAVASNVCGMKPELPAPCGVLLPPLEIPRLLRRARDADFGAVRPGTNSQASVLVFVQDAIEDSHIDGTTDGDWPLSALVQSISVLRDITFVLLCENSRQRVCADRLNTSLTDNSNLRIIDLSPSPDDDALVEGLMYALSSVDAVFCVKAAHPDFSSLLELRVEAALAAQAGLPIVSLWQSEFIFKPGNPAQLNPSFGEHAAFGAVEALCCTVLALPHSVVVHALNTGLSHQTLEALRSSILDAIQCVNSSSFEQYLEQQSASTAGRTLAAALLS